MYNRDAQYVCFQSILIIVWCMKAYHHNAEIVFYNYYSFLLMYLENNI